MFGELMEEADARAVLHRAWDLGVNTIDTGDIYAGGRAEAMIGKLVAGRRDQLVLATKVGFRVGDAPTEHAQASAGTLDLAERWSRGIAPTDQGLSRKHILSAVEASLKRLGTDHVDLYQIHRWDSAVPIEETLRALDDLVRSGKVRYIGCSNARGWQLYEALWASERHGLARFESMQQPYSLLNRGPEDEQLPASVHAGVGVIAYSALAGGAFAAAHDDGVKPGTVLAQRPAYQAKLEANRERLGRFAAFAEGQGRGRISLALAGVLAHPAVTAATVGVQVPEELDELVDAVERPLDPETYAALLALFQSDF
ncbi:MAG: aldo/keto reductase [Alphaproteobacteria bacterium]|nr:aldo/keto reductase [Alphaproteobacteria bacterium]